MSVDHTPPQKQRSYLVFEAALMFLFNTCIICRSVTRDVRKVLIGSLVRITQRCSKCNYKRVWESQPFIGSVPAGNILTSAAILYSGALPTKALRMFNILNCEMITRKFPTPSVLSTTSGSFDLGTATECTTSNFQGRK